MKRRSYLLNVGVIVALAFYSLTFVGCKGKDGDIGPAGTDGVIGSDANAVSAADQAAYNTADGFEGGKLYDSWFVYLGSTDTSVTNNGDFFRCKQCHGWDLIGSKGAYINRAPNATRPAVSGANLWTYSQQHNIRQIFDAIKNTGGRNKMSSANASLNNDHPDFGLLLTDAQIWNIVKFFKTEALNAYNCYDIQTTGTYPTGTKVFYNFGKGLGTAAAGDAYFTASCAPCHGADGHTIALEGGTMSLGDFMRAAPHEITFHGKFGTADNMMPGVSTITEQDVRDLLVAGQNTATYIPF